MVGKLYDDFIPTQFIQISSFEVNNYFILKIISNAFKTLISTCLSYE